MLCYIYLKCDGLAREGLYKNLHNVPPETYNETNKEIHFSLTMELLRCNRRDHFLDFFNFIRLGKPSNLE